MPSKIPPFTLNFVGLISSATAAGSRSATRPATGLGSLYAATRADRFGLSEPGFTALLTTIGDRYHWGLAPGSTPSPAQQLAFASSLQLDDLILARSCAAGSEPAWHDFLTRFREPLYTAAYAIAHNDTIGRELADNLYADLYGTGSPRKSPLDTYTGRGSLAGWLRAVLAQRFIDRHRRTRREDPLPGHAADTFAAPSPATPAPHLQQLTSALRQVLAEADPETRFFLSAYFLDSRTLAEIARSTGVHESTISRKLTRITANLRARLLAELRTLGLSSAAATEALSADPRDISLETPLRALLQGIDSPAFPVQSGHPQPTTNRKEGR